MTAYHAPNQTEIAILKTLLYADIFDFPLTPPEIHHFLIQDNASLSCVEQLLEQSAWLSQHIIRVNGYCALRPETAELRETRQAISIELWGQARRYGVLIAYLPFVRMVALTGALAMHNASSPQDDLDYLIVTEPKRVWLARLLTVAIVRLARLAGVQLCPNYVLSLNQLEQQRQDMYIAHELAQMIPISGHQLYEQMRAVNGWSRPFMPNAEGAYHDSPPHEVRGWGRRLQALSETLLGGRLGDWLENWEYQRKQAKFAAEAAAQTHHAAIVDSEQIKGHFNDYGHPILNRFYHRLREYGLDEGQN